MSEAISGAVLVVPDIASLIQATNWVTAFAGDDN